MDAACQASLYITNSQNLLKLMSIELVMPSNHLILCRPLLLPPSIFPSIRVFSNKSALHIRWPKYWRFSFSISHSNEYSELISFRIDWLGLLAVQRTLKSFFNTTVQKHQFFSTQLLLDKFYIVIYFTSKLLFYLLFIRPVMSDSLQPHGLQHSRPPCLSSSPRACPCSRSYSCLIL